MMTIIPGEHTKVRFEIPLDTERAARRAYGEMMATLYHTGRAFQIESINVQIDPPIVIYVIHFVTGY